MESTIEKAPKVSFGNKKLPKDTLIFNIPAVNTCPGKTEFCASKCYAVKAERLYPQVLPARKHNLKLSLSPDFVSLMIGTIAKYQKKIKQIRIHEAGDFYSQAYLDSWFLIAKEFPGIVFYAYTKSFHLEFSAKPSNFVLIASFDQSTTEKAYALYQFRQKYFDNTFRIVQKGASANCIQDCTKCHLCWSAKGLNLTVNVH